MLDPKFAKFAEQEFHEIHSGCLHNQKITTCRSIKHGPKLIYNYWTTHKNLQKLATGNHGFWCQRCQNEKTVSEAGHNAKARLLDRGSGFCGSSSSGTPHSQWCRNHRHPHPHDALLWGAGLRLRHAIFQQQNSEYVPCRAFRKNIKKLGSGEKKRHHTQPHSHCPRSTPLPQKLSLTSTPTSSNLPKNHLHPPGAGAQKSSSGSLPSWARSPGPSWPPSTPWNRSHLKGWAYEVSSSCSLWK